MLLYLANAPPKKQGAPVYIAQQAKNKMFNYRKFWMCKLNMSDPINYGLFWIGLVMVIVLCVVVVVIKHFVHLL